MRLSLTKKSLSVAHIPAIYDKLNFGLVGKRRLGKEISPAIKWKKSALLDGMAPPTGQKITAGRATPPPLRIFTPDAIPAGDRSLTYEK